MPQGENGCGLREGFELALEADVGVVFVVYDYQVVLEGLACYAALELRTGDPLAAD